MFHLIFHAYFKILLTSRCVIHYGTSLNMENYFQEVGRAGRDGQRALCVLFYSISDFSTHRYLFKRFFYFKYRSILHIFYIRYLDKNKKFKNDNTMKKYIMTAMCRRKFILSHFEESFERESQFETDCCDICTNK